MHTKKINLLGWGSLRLAPISPCSHPPALCHLQSWKI